MSKGASIKANIASYLVWGNYMQAAMNHDLFFCLSLSHPLSNFSPPPPPPSHHHRRSSSLREEEKKRRSSNRQTVLTSYRLPRPNLLRKCKYKCNLHNSVRTWQASQSIGAAKDQIEETHVLLGFQAKDTRRRMEDDEKAKAGKGCSRMRSPYILIAEEVATKENTIFFAPRES